MDLGPLAWLLLSFVGAACCSMGVGGILGFHGCWVSCLLGSHMCGCVVVVFVLHTIVVIYGWLGLLVVVGVTCGRRGGRLQSLWLG